MKKDVGRNDIQHTGFSLIELVISLGLMSLITLAMSSLLFTTEKQINRTVSGSTSTPTASPTTSEINNVAKSINDALSSKDSCINAVNVFMRNGTLIWSLGFSDYSLYIYPNPKLPMKVDKTNVYVTKVDVSQAGQMYWGAANSSNRVVTGDVTYLVPISLTLEETVAGTGGSTQKLTVKIDKTVYLAYYTETDDPPHCIPWTPAWGCWMANKIYFPAAVNNSTPDASGCVDLMTFKGPQGDAGKNAPGL